MSDAANELGAVGSGGPGQPSPDDTAAFQRFYLAPQQAKPKRGPLYRLFVGWWRDKRG